MKKMIAVSLLTIAAGLAYVPTLAQAQVGVTITLGSAPPPVRYEAVPTARRGYVWVPGYWDWNGHDYFWIKGHWVRARTGYVYQVPVWRQRHDGWYLDRGGWRGRPAHKGPPPGHMKHDRPGPHGHGKGHDRWDDRGHGRGHDRH